MNTTRRNFLAQSLAGLMSLPAFGRTLCAGESALPPVRTITRGPKHHWFGYYDKLEFDPSCRYVLGMEVDFEHRSPKPSDVIRIGMVDLHDNDRWIELGESSAWCWQQGCMLQWIPGSRNQILWNDRDQDQYVSRIFDVDTRRLRTIPSPIYALSPNGRFGVSVDFRRLGDTRPGYGYNGIPDPWGQEKAPRLSGISRVDLETGRHELLFSIADIVSLGRPLPSMQGAKHWFNHLLFNPDGTRFVFLHRWSVGAGRETRMLTADVDGKNLRILDDNGYTSHFQWRDSQHILAWSNQPSHGKRLYLFGDTPDRPIHVVAADEILLDGHCSYLPGGKWIVDDTYPDKDRLQHPFLYNTMERRIVPLGHFLSPAAYTGEWRCDTHPRISPDGKSIVIDSPHTGEGRQLHLIDISSIV